MLPCPHMSLAKRFIPPPLMRALAIVPLVVLMVACGLPPSPPAPRGVVLVVAAESFWGSIAAQIGGAHARVVTIVANPNADPHSYESTANDARAFAAAQFVILNGAGYDAWGQRLLGANPVAGRVVLDVGQMLGVPLGANPHFWYDPAVVARVATAIAADLARSDPADAGYFAAGRDRFLTVALKPYTDLIAQIRQRYAGTPVGATESIFVYLASALGLDLISPPEFMKAISEGDEPSASDRVTMEDQITGHQIALLVYNNQTVTPDTDLLRQEARAAGIPVVGITETLSPVGATFQDWQVAQLRAIEQALVSARG